MSQDNHVAALKRKHEALDNEVDQMQSKPAADPLQIQALKRQKLDLKDQISRAEA